MSKQDFLKQFDEIAAVLPLQGDARAIVHNGLEFPTTRDEYWKYTRTSSITEGTYTQNPSTVESIDPYIVSELEAYKIVFVNGLYSSSLSDQKMPKGLSVIALSNATAHDKDVICEHLGKYIESRKNAFSALNTSYFKDAAFVKIDDGVNIEKPINIIHISSGSKQAVNARNLIVLGANAQAKIILQYEGNQNEDAFTNVVSEVIVGEGAQGDLYIVQNDGNTSSHINSTQIVQSKASTFSVVTVTKSGKLVRNNLNFSVNGEGCESNMYGVYFTRGKQHVDNHTYVDHLLPHCNSNELYKGVMDDKSTGVFNGKIMVHRAAQKTNAFQSNQNVLLSDTASIFTKPELEIYADDVKCSHGCTIGQLDEEATFYLQSRGLNKDDATKLLIQAFASDVMDKVKVDALKNSLEDFIHQQFIAVNA